MKKIALALLCVTAPLAAQKWEAGVFLGQQTYKSLDTPAISALSLPAGTLKADRKTVYGARIGYSVLDIGPALFQVTAGYQPKSEADVKFDDIVIPDVKYTHQHYSVGAMFNFKAMVAVGAGIEYRFEKVGFKAAGVDETANYSRPWLRANVGYAFPTPVLKPFVGLEMAMPLLRENAAPSEVVNNPEKAYKAMAPRFQVGLYAGIRF